MLTGQVKYGRIGEGEWWWESRMGLRVTVKATAGSQARCEGVGEGEWWWEPKMGPKVKVRATAGAIDIDYILVVGHFGLATGSGGITQSNMHNESCPKPFTPR